MNKSLTALLAAALVALFPPSAQAGPYHSLLLALPMELPVITVPANRVLTILTFAQSYGPAQGTYLTISRPGAQILFFATTQSSATNSDINVHGPEGVTVAGPATIAFTLNAQAGVLFTYKLGAN